MLKTVWFDTPDGLFGVTQEGDAVTEVLHQSGGDPTASEDMSQIQQDAARQIREYLDGTRRELDFSVKECGTPFQVQVWAALREIPYGQTRTYGEIAAVIGRPAAVRAVGAACGRNPLPLLTPCHRVIGACGKLTGFRFGLPLKRRLLELEGAV